MLPAQPGALQAIMEEGLRMLHLQYETHRAALASAQDLLKVAVAALGGTIVVSGIVSAASLSSGIWPWASVACGVALLVAAAAVLAPVSAGLVKAADLVYGPDLARVVSRLRKEGITQEQWRWSIVEATPQWLEHNARSLAQVQSVTARAFLVLVSGVVLILLGLFYITGGSMLGLDA